MSLDVLKSLIFIVAFGLCESNNRFSGRRSEWTIPFWWQYLIALTTSYMYFRETDSDNLLCSDNSWSRIPPSRYSDVMYKKLLVSITSNTFTMFGWSYLGGTKELKIIISSFRELREFSFIEDFLISFRARVLSVCLCWTRYTQLYVPLPMMDLLL